MIAMLTILSITTSGGLQDLLSCSVSFVENIAGAISIPPTAHITPLLWQPPTPQDRRNNIFFQLSEKRVYREIKCKCFFWFNNKICFLLFWKNRVTTEVDLLCSQIGFPHSPFPFSFLIFLCRHSLQTLVFFLLDHTDRSTELYFL